MQCHEDRTRRARRSNVETVTGSCCAKQRRNEDEQWWLMIRRADLQLVKESGPTAGESRTHNGRKSIANRMQSRRNESKSEAMVQEVDQVPHRRSASRSLIFDARDGRLADQLGSWDHVTGTVVEQGCDMDADGPNSA